MHYPINHKGLQEINRQMWGRLWELGTRVHSVWRRLGRPAQPLPLLVVGSLRAGGTGKTDWVAWLAGQFPDAAILVHPTGDEEFFLEHRYQNRVFVHRNWLKAWEFAQKSGYSWAICDGGLQDPALNACAALCLGPTEGIGYADLHPFGPFRQRRATRPLDLCLREERDFGWTIEAGAPGPVLMACGIARPEQFRCDLQLIGMDVVGECVVRDHGRLSVRRIRALERSFPGVPWCLTSKDAARGDGAFCTNPVRVVERRLSVPETTAQQVRALVHTRILEPLSSRSGFVRI